MATYTPTNKQSSAYQDYTGNVNSVACVWEIGSATLGTADVLTGPTVPANSVIVGGSLSVSDLDTGATLTLDVGDATDDNRFLAASTIGQAGGFAAFAAVAGGGYKYTAATRVDVTPAAASAGGVAGGTLAMEIRYIVLESTS